MMNYETKEYTEEHRLMSQTVNQVFGDFFPFFNYAISDRIPWQKKRYINHFLKNLTISNELGFEDHENHTGK